MTKVLVEGFGWSYIVLALDWYTNNLKGNADTERIIRPLKEECLWLQDWTCPLALIRALEGWIAHDNGYDLHSALGYKTPRQFEREYRTSHSTQFAAA